MSKHTVSQAALRPALPGDICLLLAPADPQEEHDLRKRQEALQKCFGGQRVDPVHLTLQRFDLSDDKRLRALVKVLPALCVDLPQLQFQTDGLQTLSRLDGTLILKWRLTDIPPIGRFVDRLEGAIGDFGGRSAYPPGWRSTLITTLREVNPDGCASLLDFHAPRPLFTARQMIVSRIIGRFQYQDIAAFPLPNNS